MKMQDAVESASAYMCGTSFPSFHNSSASPPQWCVIEPDGSWQEGPPESVCGAVQWEQPPTEQAPLSHRQFM